MSMTTTRRAGISSTVSRTRRAGAIARAAGTAGSMRRPGAAAMAAGAAAFAAGPVFGQVSGEQVTHGTASFQRQGTLTTITTSNNAIINYNSFNIRANETVRFVQPDSLSRVLNRINSSAPTQIDGAITSNGRVYIVNPAGIYFSKGAMINVGGMYAAAGTITNQDFLRGVDRFVTAPGGKVINEGTIQAPVIGLIGSQVANFGALSAPEGAVMMVSGDTVLMGERDGHVYAKIETSPAAGPEPSPSAPGTSALGSPTAPKPQGRFGAGDMYSLAVWNRGTVKADHVRLEAQRGAVSVAGTLDASNSSKGGTGGSVEVLGQAVAVQGATIDASGDAGGGRVLVGGNYQGSGGERRAQHTTVTSGSDLRADAITNGDGGTVIVWSDTATRFDGHISAKGGAQGGDGGFAEISSKQRLTSNVNVDLSAPHGDAGTLLFDPAFIRIDGGLGDGSDNDDTGSSLLKHTDNSGATVVVAPSNTDGTIDFGDFGLANVGDTLATPFIIRESEIEGTNANIFLKATESITVSGNFDHDVNGAGVGVVRLFNNNNLTIEVSGSTGAGAIDLVTGLTGATATSGLLFQTQGTGTISILGSTAGPNATDITVGRLQTASRDITISTANGLIALTNTINAGTGTVRLSATSMITQTGAGSIITAGAIGARAGTGITLDAAPNALTDITGVFAASLSGTGTVAFRNNPSFVVGTVADVTGTTDAVGINAPGGTVKIASDTGFISQVAASPIITDALSVKTALSQSFVLTTNDANTVAFELTGGSGSITYVDADGFTVGTVPGVGASTVTGINAGTRNVSLSVVGSSTDSNAVTQGATSPVIGGMLTLASTGTPGLPGTFDFTASATNAVTDLLATTTDAANASSVSFLNSANLSILTTSSVSGNLSVSASGATGKITPGAAITVRGNLSLTANEIDLATNVPVFTPGAASLTATLQPFDDGTAVNIENGAAAFDILKLDLTRAVGTFPSLIVGRDTGTALLSYGGTTGFAQNVTLRSGGAGGAVTLLDGSNLSTTAGQNITIKAGTGNSGVFTMQTGVPAILNAGAGTISITADALALGTADTIRGSGPLLLQPASPLRGIKVGGTDDVAQFSIDSNEFLAINEVAGPAKFSKIVIGRDNSNAPSSIDTVTVHDPLVFQTPAGGAMTISSLTADGGIALVTGGALGISQAFNSSGGEITLKSGSSLTIANNINAGAGTVRLISGGDITEGVGVQIIAGALGVQAAGDVNLNRTNNVGTFEATTTGAGKFVAYNDADLVNVGAVGAETLNNGTAYFTGTGGVTTNEGNFTLVSGGAVGIGNTIDTGITPAGGIVRIAAAGTVVQTGGHVKARQMAVRSQGSINFTLIDNQIGTVALDTSASAVPASVQLLTLNGLTVGSVAADGAFPQTDGLVSTQDAEITVNSGSGAMAIEQPINAGVGTVRLASQSSIYQSNIGPNDGRILGGTLGLRSGSNSPFPLANTPTTIAVNTGSGDFYYNLNAGNLTIGDVTEVGTGGSLFAATSGLRSGTGTVRLISPGTVTQTAASGITAGSLAIRSANTVGLTDSTNAVGTLGIFITNAGQSATYRDSDGLIIGQVTGFGPFATVDGVNTAGDVSIRAGSLQLDELIDVGGSRDVRLTSGAGITQNTTPGKGIIAKRLGVKAGGDAKLLNPSNSVETFTGLTTGGVLKYFNASAGTLDIDTLADDSNGFTGVSGLQSTGDALIDASGAVFFKQNVDAGAGTLRVVSTAGVSQQAGTTVKAAGLGVLAGGAVDLSQTGNMVGTVAGTTSAAAAPFAVSTTGTLAVDGITFDPDGSNFPSTVGITTTNGAVSLISTGAQTLNEPIDAGTAVVRLASTAGGITQTAGNIIASSLGARAAGDIRLDSVNGLGVPLNNVGTFAASASGAGNVTFLDADGFNVGSVALSGAFPLTNGISTGGATRLLARGVGGISQTFPISSAALGVITDGPASFGDVGNTFGTFASRSLSLDSVTTTGGLSIGTVGVLGNFPGVSGITVTGIGPGTTFITSGGTADMTLAQSINVGTGTLVLNSGGRVNQTGGSLTAALLGVNAGQAINIESTGNDVDVFAARTNSGVVKFVDADGLIIGTVPAASLTGVVGTGAIELQAGAGGTGDLTFGTGVTVRGTDVTLRAGDGPGGAGTASKVDARTNSPTFDGDGVGTTHPSFTFRQDADIDTSTASLPLPAQFTFGVSPTYRLQSDDGNIVANTDIFSNNTDLTLAVTPVVPPAIGKTVQVTSGGNVTLKSLTIIGTGIVQKIIEADKIEFNGPIQFDDAATFLLGDEINFFGPVTALNPGAQTLTLRPKSLGRKINVGEAGSELYDPNPTELDLTRIELDNIRNQFSRVVIGEDPLVQPTSALPNLTGIMEILGPVTFMNPTTLGMRGAGSSIRINNPITMTGAPLTVKGTGSTTTLAADITTNGQVVDIQDSVLVSGARTIDTTSGAPGAAVTIQGPTDGLASSGLSNTLTINSGTGATTLTNAVGGATLSGGSILDALTITGATISLPTVTTTGLQSYTGTTTLNGNLTSTVGGAIGLNGTTLLAAPNLLVTTAGGLGDNVVFGGTADGASDLTVNVGAAGQAQVGFNIGGATPLTKLTVFGQTLLTAPAITLTTALGAGNTVSLFGPVNGSGSALTVNSGGFTLGGNVALGAFTVNAPTLLSSDPITITTTGAPGVVFNGTVDSVSTLSGLGLPDLTVSTNVGAATFGAAVGGTTPLGALTVNGGTIALQSVRTFGAQSFTGSTTLNGNLTSISSGTIAVTGGWLLGAPAITVQTAGGATDNITFTGASQAGSAGRSLTVNAGGGAVTFTGGDVGATGAALASLTATGSTINLGNVFTSGAQSYTGATTLNGDLSSTGLPITITGDTTLAGVARSVTSAGGNITFTQKVDGPSAFTVNSGAGTTTFGGAVGSTARPASLTATGSSIINGSSVATNGAQLYTGATRFGGNVTVQNTGAGVRVNGPLTFTAPTVSVTTAGAANSDSINFSNIDGASNVTLFAGAAPINISAGGSTTALNSLTATGSTIVLQSMNTTGAQTYNGTTTVVNSVSGGALTFNGATIVNASATGSSLVATGPTQRFGSVSTTGNQTFTGTTTIQGTDSGAALVFNGPTDITGSVTAANLAANATTGTTRMRASVTTTGDQSYLGPTTLDAGAQAERLFFGGNTVLGNPTAESTYKGNKGVRVIGTLGLFGNTVISGGDGQIYFHSTVQTAPGSPNRSLQLVSTLEPRLISSGDASANNPSTFSAYVNSPFLFNANVGGDYPGGGAPNTAQRAVMLESLTFSRGGVTSIPPVATILLTKGLFTVPQASGGQASGGTPSTDINQWFNGTNAALRLGGFTIPDAAPYNLTQQVTVNGVTSTVFYIEPSDPNVTTRINTTTGFDMGQSNKAVSIGNMFVFVDAGRATLGDMASLADINIILGSGTLPTGVTRGITVNSRNPSLIATNQFIGTANVPTTTNDTGVDFVALNRTNFWAFPTINGTGSLNFSAPEGRTDSSGNPISTFSVVINGVPVDQFPGGQTVNQQNNNILRSVFKGANVDKRLFFPAEGTVGSPQFGAPFSNLVQFGLGLDLQAAGVNNNPNVATALAGALPNQNVTVVQNSISLGSNALQALNELGFEVKSTTGPDYYAERAGSLSGRTDYNDVPRYAKPDSTVNQSDYKVSLDRLSAESVSSVLAAYYDLLGEDITARVNRRDSIKRDIGESWDKYLKQLADGVDPDGRGFRLFVENDPSESKTLGHLQKIGELLRRMDRLALTPAELERPRQQTLGVFASEGIETLQLEEAALNVQVSRPAPGVALLTTSGGAFR